MKKPPFFLCIILSLYILGCDINDFDISESNIKAYYDYSFSNKHVILSADTTLTYIHFAKNNFMDYFFMIYDHRDPVVIPEKDFDNKLFVSFIKIGLYFSKITLSKSSRNGESLDLYFNSTKTPSSTCYFAVPVIVSIPNGYKKVRIMENNIFVKTLVIK